VPRRRSGTCRRVPADPPDRRAAAHPAANRRGGDHPHPRGQPAGRVHRGHRRPAVTPPALLRLEAVLQWRYGIVAALAALAAAWTGVLALLPAAAARIVAPWVLLLDTAVAGATLVGTMVVLEREPGMQAALAAPPAGPGGRVAARVGVLLGVTVAAAVPVALAGRPVSPAGLALALLGVGLVAAITALAGVAVAARRGSVIAFLIALPLILLPLMLPAAAHLAGLTHPGLYAIPLTGAVDLLRSGYGDPL